MLNPNPIVIILKTKYILITKVNNLMPWKCWKYYISPGCLSSKKGKDHCHSIKLYKCLWKSWYQANFQSAFRWLLLEIACHQEITRQWSLPFLHSVIYDMKKQLSAQRTCDLNEMTELIRHETTSNNDLYVSFLLQGTRAILLSQMNMCTYNKMYDSSTPYGDMLPLVLCNALCLNLIILSQTASGYDIRTVVGRSSNNSCIGSKFYKSENGGQNSTCWKIGVKILQCLKKGGSIFYIRKKGRAYPLRKI